MLTRKAPRCPFCSARRSYTWLSCRWLTRSGDYIIHHVAVRPSQSPYERLRAALHNMMHAAASLGKALVLS
jgi:hypothetical protein